MEGLSAEKQSCAEEVEILQNGAELCSYDVCMLCNEGKLEIPPELSTNSDDLLADPAEAYFVSGYTGCNQ
jgi:hypothetical protein